MSRRNQATVVVALCLFAGTVRAGDVLPAVGSSEYFDQGKGSAVELTPVVVQDAPEPAEAGENAATQTDAPMAESSEDPYFRFYDPPYEPWFAARFGWWGVGKSGARSGTGEWQGLESSPFWDVDGIRSDGSRTIDFFATGVESESTDAGVYYYGGPGLTIDFDYDRFIHRIGHDPLIQPEGGFFDPPLPNNTPGYVLYGTDLNVGQDYAIRVQKIEADFKGNLNDDVKWGLKVWGMRKDGTRMVNSTQHCFALTPAPGGRTCHVVSQGQQIDWLTTEVEPSIRARFDWLTVEYSRTMRSFQQNDQTVLANFTAINATYGLQGVGAYAVVPENYTEIDRVKMNAQLNEYNELYALAFVGNTHNDFRDSDRKFYGGDVRLTNTSRDALRLTAYAKSFVQNNSADTIPLNVTYPGQANLWRESQTPQTIYNPDSYYLGLADRETHRAGFHGRWHPHDDYDGAPSWLAVTGGYEYKIIERSNVTYFLDALPAVFTQPDSNTHMFFVGLEQDWSREFDTYLRYRVLDTDWPLLGVTHRQQLSLDAAINSNQPEHEDRIEIGGNWSPTNNFMLNASLWIQNRYNHSEFVNFDEDNYPVVLSGWYAPTDRWSMSAGAATFSNWIDQDVTLGRENGVPGTELTAFTSRWNYGGRADVLNLGTTYLWNDRVQLIGGFEYVRSWNRFTAPPAPATAIGGYDDLPAYSQVRVNTYRFTAGVDYTLTELTTCFFRYNYFDYDDIASPFNAGTAHLLLGGISAVY